MTPDSFLAGGGDMGIRMRGLDWTGTPLGAVQGWPQSLRTAVSILINSKYPMFLAWGPQLAFLYNDGYGPILGVKHPHALGRPFAEIWSEIWSDIKPLVDRALAGDSTWSEDLPLFMTRHGYSEEVYFTFSYSPIRDESGGVGGMFCACTETTGQVLQRRRLRTLTELTAAAAVEHKTVAEIEALCMRAISANREDIPFAMLYRYEEADSARLAACTGVEPDSELAPRRAQDDDVWPLASVRGGAIEHIEGLAARTSEPPRSAWNDAVDKAVVLPVPRRDQGVTAAALMLGLSPRREFDAAYNVFVESVASAVATAIASARASEIERERADTLAELDRAKTAFFSNVSHEFRTPLTLLLGPLDDLLKRPPEELGADRVELQTAHRNALRLLRLVNTLLDFSRVEAGRVEASYEPVDLCAVTTDLTSNFRSACERAGLKLTIRCATDLPVVHVDRDMWEKIVLNLLSNAFKYTFHGGVEVEVRRGADERSAMLTVRDSGVGIPQEELPRIFDRFHRIPEQMGRTLEGTGIGLSLVQELVRQHCGSISAESVVGEGSTFRVLIPLGVEHLPPERIGAARRLASTAMRATAFVEEALRWLPESEQSSLPGIADSEAPHAAGDSPDRARVLIADDNADMRHYLERLLRGRFDVQTVPDGLVALDAIRTRKPDLLITDAMMPRLDGIALLAEIRKDQGLRTLPVLMLSARAGENEDAEGRAAGADDYLVKPFSTGDLLARTENLLRLARARTETVVRLEQEIEKRTAERDRVWLVSSELMAAAGLDGYLKAANPAWKRILGYERKEVMRTPYLDLVHPEDRETSLEVVGRLRAGDPVAHFENRLRHKDGTFRWISWTTVPGNDVFYAVGRDITEVRTSAHALRVAEEQLRQAQKMEAIGHLTGGVAHDFNNLLTVVIGNLDSLQRHLPASSSERLQRAADHAMQGAMRAASLTQRLLAFARRQPLNPKPIDANRLVSGMTDLLTRTLGERIEVRTVLAGGLWLVEVDPNQLESALLNLAVNARDAMPDGGKLTIETANVRLDRSSTGFVDEVKPGQYVAICVSDTGVGMSQEVLTRAFEPFFTTKPTGHGTGLGLSQIYGFVKQSGGHVKLNSEPGAGASAKLYLPRLIGVADEESIAAAPPAPEESSSETVLVVEDEDSVREYACGILLELGYRVLQARDGPAALRILDENQAIDLLLSDVGLPSMNGRELATEALKRRPSLKVLFMSGYARDAIVHHGRLDPGVEMISKPFTYSDVAVRIRQVLSR